MAKSELKTLIAKLYNVDRTKIEFNYDDLSISVDGQDILSINVDEDRYCCGIQNAGGISIYINSDIDLTEEDKDNLIQKLMNQLLKMIEACCNKGLVTFSHIEDNEITQALIQESYNGPWKQVSNFINPNSGNKVFYFVAEINQEEV